jgi:acetyl esterase/lipase
MMALRVGSAMAWKTSRLMSTVSRCKPEVVNLHATVWLRNQRSSAFDFPGHNARMRTGSTLRFALLIALASTLHSAGAAEHARHLLDIPYATVDGHTLALDLHLPAGIASPPLVVYAHGGAWRAGSKTEYPEFLLASGFAVASVEFRSSTVARFPADAQDIKAAIRFLRARQKQYGYRTDRIAIAGTSSGGHLAALVGTSNAVRELEGTVGENLGQSSDVQAIVSWYGASNFATILPQSTPFGLNVREPALKLLLGDVPDKVPELARLASPVSHVGPGDPPALLLHGNQDRQMPVNQLLELEAAYRRAGLSVETLIVDGAGHGDKAFNTGDPAERVVSFLRRTIGR